MNWLRRTLIDILIGLLEREIGRPERTLTDVEERGLLSDLWQNGAFRKHVADRNVALVHLLAGGDGMKPEPRDDYLIHSGQRVENLIFAQRAKVAYQRVAKDHQTKLTLAKEQTASASSQA